MATSTLTLPRSPPGLAILSSFLLSLLVAPRTVASQNHTDNPLETNDTSLTNLTLLSVNVTSDPAWGLKYSTPAAVVICLIFVTIILGTLVGNVLVCVAVCLVRKLRRPSNYLIVSLAVSDMLVALLVMPVSSAYEIMGFWPFGAVLCDFWLSADVLCCTASILNLCMISVDRYFAITKPLEYGVQRTPRRMFMCVCVVWLGAALITLPPVLYLGNIKTAEHCSVSQNEVYQVYATFCSFYIPLAVMIVVYFKIFSAAQKIVREERRAQSHLETHCYLEINVQNGSAAEARLLEGAGEGAGAVPARGSTASTNTTISVEKADSGIGRCFSGQRKSYESQCPMLQQPKTPTKPIHTINKPCPTSTPSHQPTLAPPKTKRRRESSESSHVSATNRIRSSLTSFSKAHFGAKDLIQATHSTHQKKLRFQLAKERKASTTLGIIMSAFVVCWLPFFVLALTRPFLHTTTIPDSVSALFLWLGYANSLLNPIIYATLNRDFRKPFQEILFFRCSNLNHMMREEFYHSHYGDPDQHYCAVNQSVKIHDGGVEIVTTVQDESRASESFL